VEYFRLGEDGHWVLSEFSRQNDRLQISAPDLNLSLRELYLDIVFEKKEKATDSTTNSIGNQGR
jgi:Uma2 family endonuclease